MGARTATAAALRNAAVGHRRTHAHTHTCTDTNDSTPGTYIQAQRRQGRRDSCRVGLERGTEKENALMREAQTHDVERSSSS